MFTLRCIIVRTATEMKFKIHQRGLKTVRRTISLSFLFNKRNLLLTNIITSGACMALGDLAEQELEYQNKILSVRYDWARISRMFFVGTFLLGLPHHYYYLYIDKWLPEVNLKTVFIKIFCDQTIAGPLTLVTFFYGMGLLENKSIVECTDEIKKKIVFSYIADCTFWPPVQFINFYYVPGKYRLIYINIATMIFNVFLSYMKHYDQH